MNVHNLSSMASQARKWHNVIMPAKASIVWIVFTVGCWDSGAWLLAMAASPSTAEVSGGI